MKLVQVFGIFLIGCLAGSQAVLCFPESVNPPVASTNPPASIGLGVSF